MMGNKDPEFRLLVVDDDETLTNAVAPLVQNRLSDEQFPGTVLPCPYREGMDLLREIVKCQPSDVLLDIRLGGGNTQLVEDLIPKLAVHLLAPRVWLMSAYEERNAHERLRADYPAIVQVAWFAKPLWLDEVLPLILEVARHSQALVVGNTGPGLDDLIGRYSDLPIPVRVFDDNGDLRANPAWQTAPNQPPLKPFLEATRSGRKELEPDWWLSPSSGDLEHLKWHLSPLEQGFWLQLPVHTQPPDPREIEELACLTARVMSRGGFSRGRIYTLEMVPNSLRPSGLGKLRAENREEAAAFLRLRYFSKDGELTVAQDKDHPEGKMVHPLYGQLSRRMETYLDRFEIGNKLIYHLRKRSEDAADDPGIQYWNKCIPDYGQLDSWLEIPLFSINDKRQGVTLVGVLVFDRLGAEPIGDAPAGVVSEGLVHALERVVLKLCRLWRKWRRELVTREESLWREHLDQQQAGWVNKSSATLGDTAPGADASLEQAILQVAVECVHTDSGILAIQPLGSRTLRIRAWQGQGTGAPDLSHLFLPLVNKRFLACRVFAAKEALHLVDYHRRPVEDRLSSTDWREAGANPEQLDTLTEWSSNLASILAIPVIHAGKAIAVLVLHKSQPFHFTTYRVSKINLLAERAAWMLAVDREVQHRYRWENLLLHNMRGFPMRYAGEIRALRKMFDVNMEQAAIAINRMDLSTKQMTHIVEGYRWLIAGGGTSEIENEVAVDKVTRELLSLFSEEAIANQITLPESPWKGDGWNTRLSAPFDLVWYNILHNAVRHANYGGQVELQAETRLDRWLGLVWNSIRKEDVDELQSSWKSEQTRNRPIPKQGTGMGIGLRASHAVCTDVGAHLVLTVEQRGEQMGITVTLNWPLDITRSAI